MNQKISLIHFIQKTCFRYSILCWTKLGLNIFSRFLLQFFLTYVVWPSEYSIAFFWNSPSTANQLINKALIGYLLEQAYGFTGHCDFEDSVLLLLQFHFLKKIFSFDDICIHSEDEWANWGLLIFYTYLNTFILWKGSFILTRNKIDWKKNIPEKNSIMSGLLNILFTFIMYSKTQLQYE